MNSNYFWHSVQRVFSLAGKVSAGIHIRNIPLTMLFFFIFSLSLPYQAQASYVSFIGNTEIDFLASCELESKYTDVTIVIKKDGIQIAESAGGTDPNYREIYYRDTAVSMGNTYKYTGCCIYESDRGQTESCSSRSATAGEVGGTLRQDLEISGGIVTLHDGINVAKGIILSINGATIERAVDSRHNIMGESHAESAEYGTIRITNSALTDANIYFKSAGNNLLSGNIITGSQLTGISKEANIVVRGNTFADSNFYIKGDTTSHILQNTFQNSSIGISGSDGKPTVLIDSNKFISLERRAVDIGGGDVTVKANIFTGQDGGNDAYGIRILDGANSIISDNLLTGLKEALNISGNNNTIVTGNVIKSNDTGYKMRGEAVATVTGNTFFQNRIGVVLYEGTPPTFNNNCISGNDTGLSLPLNPAMIDARNNWWGGISGPRQNYYDNSAGIGDLIPIGGTVNFTPWLTTSNCEDVPSLPEPEPATLHVSIAPDSLPADGQSQAILTISLQDENSQPVANAELTLGTPEFGSLNQLSGSTDAAGQLRINYTAPTAAELNGKDFVELNIHYPTSSVSDSAIIEFTFAKVSTWADPHISPYPSEVAIIPGDERFPGRYQFTLYDYDGQNYAGETLSISIADSNIARVEGDGQSGRQIEMITDAQGRVIVDYIYLGSPKIGNIPFEDSITVSHKALSVPFEAKVSIGLDIEITDLYTPQRDTGVFPKTLAMRIQLADSFRPDMDLRAYWSELEEISGHSLGMNITTEWLNPPKPEFIDIFRDILPNYISTAAPQLYKGHGVINHADKDLKQIIVEALDLPRVTYGPNTLPAITFKTAGNYWFGVQANPVILPKGTTSSNDFVHGASRLDLSVIFAASVLENAESVFQSLACSFKPTSKTQFVVMNLLSDPIFELITPVAALNKMTKVSGIICDYMQGNYVTAALSITSMRIDALKEAYTSGALDISLEQFLKLGKLVKLNEIYSEIDFLNSVIDMLVSDRTERRADNILSIKDNWPENLSLAEYKDIMNKTISGEMAAYDDFNGWQLFGILSDGAVDMSRIADETEYFSHDGLHVFLLPTAADTVNIKTSSDADIYRFYRASVDEIFTAEYNFSAADIVSQLNFSLLEADLKIDSGADGTIDDSFSPEINKVDTTWTALEIITNQQTYQPGETLTISATLENPGDALLVDVYFSVTSPAGELYSIPDLSPGQSPLVTNFEMPGHFVLPETTIFSFPVPESLSGAGQFKIEAFLSYPGTLDAVGGNISSRIISFP